MVSPVERRPPQTVDELRPAGALQIPAAWRKSLHVERDRFTGLFDEDDASAEVHAGSKKEQPTPVDLEIDR